MYYIYFGYRNEYVRNCDGGSYKLVLEEPPKDLIPFLETTIRKQFPDMEILQTEPNTFGYTVFGVDPSKRIWVCVADDNNTDTITKINLSMHFKEYF